MPGNLMLIEFSDMPPESLLMLETDFRLEEKTSVRLLVNTPANVHVQMDGQPCFCRESGAMIPAFHRAPANQLCELELDAGIHTLTIGVAPATESMAQAELLWGLADASNQWLITPDRAARNQKMKTKE